MEINEKVRALKGRTQKKIERETKTKDKREMG